MANYTTMQGDTWDGIAYKLYQDESYMTDLMKLNPDLTQTVIFSAGVVLSLPEVVEPQQATDLPPWKRGG